MAPHRFDASQHPSRRATLGGLAAVGVGTLLPTLSAPPARAAASGSNAASATSTLTATSTPIQLTLPPPTGPYRVGTVALHLVDPSRRDPWVPSHPPRELMIGIWYPARDVDEYYVAPWLLPGAWDLYQQDNGLPPGVAAVPLTHGHSGAPVDRRDGPHPVLLFSPGSGGDRDSSTTVVEDLVSHGYIVVTIDHTHDGSEVEFPDGRVEGRTIPPDTLEINTEAVAVRVADTRFVLDQLSEINRGRNPDVEHHRLPPGMEGALDLTRVGMFGHSMGGATAAWAMLDDRRIRAGINMDGSCYGPVLAQGLDRPFLLMCSQLHDKVGDPTWAELWSHLRGWHKELRLAKAGHLSYNDIQSLLPEAATALGFPLAQVTALIGTVDPTRSVLAVRTYTRAYFDHFVRHRDSRLLDGPSPEFPEIEFLA